MLPHVAIVAPARDSFADACICFQAADHLRRANLWLGKQQGNNIFISHLHLLKHMSDIKSKCLGTRVLTRAATARAPLWLAGKRSDEGGKRMLRTTAQARWLKIIVGWGFSSTMCSYKASSVLSTSELVASSASLASMDPSQQEDYVASLR